MKRDADLLREILLKVESLGPPNPDHSGWTIIEVEGHHVEEVRYHLDMLVAQGFLKEEAVNLWTTGSEGMRGDFSKCRPDAITIAGHDFLDSVRDPALWRSTKSVAGKAGGFTIDLLKEISKALIKGKIKEYTGFEV